MRVRLPSPAQVVVLLASLAVLGTFATAQDDLRDRVTLRDGRVVEGRVVTPFAPDELLLLQGGRRVRIARSRTAASSLVGDRVRQFFERRLRHRDARRAQRYLVDWAVTNQLPGLARLQATWLLLTGDDHDDDQALRELLGHKQQKGAWLWPHDGRFVPLDRLEQALAEEPLRLVGERFALRCDAGFATNVAALLDLEHMAVVFLDRFGSELDLREVLRPIEVRTFRNADEFPKWGFRPRPYYEPPPHEDIARTYFTGAAPDRPELLFFVGAQGLLYRTLIGEADAVDDRDRVCAWLEVGLGMWCEHVMQGPAGFAAAGEPQAIDVAAMRALQLHYRLAQLLHLPMYGSFYQTADAVTQTNWQAAAMFVSWLLRDDNEPPTRAPFLRFVRAALGDRLGDSSTAFDRFMGRRVEELEEPWRAWLARTAGY